MSSPNPISRALVEALLLSTGLSNDYGFFDVSQSSREYLHRRFSSFLDRAEKKVRVVHDSWVSLDEFCLISLPYTLERDYVHAVVGDSIGFWDSNRWEPRIGKILNGIIKDEARVNAYVGNDQQVHIAYAGDQC